MDTSLRILPIHEEDQINEYYCGPAAVVMVLRQLGIHASQKECAKLVSTSAWYGTDTKTMHQAFVHYKIPFEIIPSATPEQISTSIDRAKFCIVLYQGWGNALMVRAGYGSHYSVICGYDREHYYLANPDIRRENKHLRSAIHAIKKQEFERLWYGRVGPRGRMTKQWMMTVPAGSKPVSKTLTEQT